MEEEEGELGVVEPLSEGRTSEKKPAPDARKKFFSRLGGEKKISAIQNQNTAISSSSCQVFAYQENRRFELLSVFDLEVCNTSHGHLSLSDTNGYLP